MPNKLLFGLAVLGLSILLSGCQNAPVKELSQVPIIDGHIHLFRNVDPDDVRKRFKQNNVIGAVWFPRKFKTRGISLGVKKGQADQFQKDNPDLGYVMVGLQRGLLHKESRGSDLWLHPSEKWDTWLNKNKEKVRSGERAGYGELIVRHYSYSKGRGERDYPLDSKVFHDLMAASNETSSPLVIHAEGEDHVVTSLMNILPRYPRAKLIWAHACGRSNPKKITKWLLDNPNLYCDLGNMTDTGHYGSLWPRYGEWTYRFEKNGVIEPNWVALLEAMPSRFYIGSDINEEGGWDNKVWEKRIQRFRLLLTQLSPNASEWVAWKTVKALYE